MNDCVRPVNVDMPVKMICWPENLQEPAKSFNSLVRQIRLIVYTPGRCMADKDIQVSPIDDLVSQQAGDKPKYIPPHISLRI